MNNSWKVYIVQCADSSLYCGITNNIDQRLYHHNNTKKGAKYTRARRPVVLAWSCNVESRSKASKLEYKIKKLKRNRKLKIIQGALCLRDLSSFLEN